MKPANHEQEILIRESSIELLKIMAIFLIVINHTVQTLSSENLYIPYQDYVINLSVASTNIQYFILTLFRYFGALGNTIFFVCSAWFLLNSSKFKKQKWLFMLIENWVISIIILVISFIARHGDISGKFIYKSLFPNIFGNNWYLTCYLLFYPIHPLLNILINHLNKKSLLRLSSAMFILYCCFGFIKYDWFFSSPIILWITIYFVMAYIRLYLNDFANDKRRNCILLIIGVIGVIGVAFITNIIGLHISFMQDQMLRFAISCNPFIITMAIALFNIVRNVHFKNAIVNYISSLSLLIYLIHENLIIRTYYRPYLINYVYTVYGYNHIIFWTFIVALFIFMFSLISSIIYQKTICKIVKKAINLLYPFLRKEYLNIEHIILKLH